MKSAQGCLSRKRTPKGIDDLDGRDARLHDRRRGATIALEGELDVFRRQRIAVVELHARAQDELVHQAILRDRPGLGQAPGLRLARHGLHEGVVQRVQDQERRDETRCLGRIEEGRRQREVDGPGHLSRGRVGGPSLRDPRGRRDGQGDEEQCHDRAGETPGPFHSVASVDPKCCDIARPSPSPGADRYSKP
jgi:hypothetical protein